MKTILHLPPKLQEENSSPARESLNPIPKIGDSGWFPIIEKHPVIGYVLVRAGREISSRPCSAGGMPTRLAAGAEIIGVVSAPPGIEAVEYCSAVEIRDDVFVHLGYQYPNEKTDWEAEAIEREEFRLSQVDAGGAGAPRILSREEFEAVSQ